jgi:hypothetical protein|eukprot:COSAG01_NODE_12514_length_1727_cov_0.941646_2_plen_154_part_00
MMRFSVKLPSSRPPHGHGSECVGGWVGPVCGSRIEAQLAAEAARRRAQARLRRRQSGGQDKLDTPGLEDHGDDTTTLDAAAAEAEAAGTSMETAAVAPSAQVVGVEVEVEALREEVTRLRAENARLTHSLHQCRQQGPPPPPPPPSPPQAGAR